LGQEKGRKAREREEQGMGAWDPTEFGGKLAPQKEPSMVSSVLLLDKTMAESILKTSTQHSIKY